MQIRTALLAAAIVLCAAPLCGCATSSSAASEAWVGGDPARLSADATACRQESAAVDPNVIGGYSDARYGMTSAMAAAVAKGDPMADHRSQARAAAFAACMGDKGWRQPQ
jgi:hypothetical protein